MKVHKLFLISFIAVTFLFSGCENLFGPKNPDDSSSDNGGNNTSSNSRLEDKNPTVSSLASESQDFIFNTDSVGITNITIRRSEWNKMLSYFDYFYKNENSVLAESYEYEKDGKVWKLNTVGLRLRGNTSRFRPQGKDSPTDETGHTQPNFAWSQAYYNYAKNCSDNDYRQSHFKVDFEPLDDDDRKMSGCMKSVALKRCDSVFSREIFCYKLFHQYGIWTAPRASQTKVYINFIEDVGKKGKITQDISDCKTTKIDFGVYEMFEEVNKQSLKGRMKKKENNTALNAWENNDGDLWKCSGGDLSAESNSANNFGCEQVEILNVDKDKSQWKAVWFGPCYDLKTNKNNVATATNKFQGFITELNNLSGSNPNTAEGIQARKSFYEKWFDVDFFIKTYAVNMLFGMDDDYWGNANNYYLYFDNGKNGNEKCYYIPFDYDNSLGCSITGDKVFTNPFLWGNGHNRPLLDRLLEVPEYVEKMKNTLLEVSSQDSDSPWNKENCFELWNKWRSQVISYVSTKDIKGWPNIGSTGWNDDGGWKEIKHYLTQDDNNLYEQVTYNFQKWLANESSEIKFDLNGGSVDGESGILTRKYNGITNSLAAMVYSTPVRNGYAFLGWTKTKDGADYIDNYSFEKDLTVYASWLDISGYSDFTIIEIPDTAFKGIKIFMTNLPENNYNRTIYINGKEVGADSFANSEGAKNSKYGNVWAYPFTETGKTYLVKVSFSDKNYSWLADSNELEVTAKSGEGEFKVTNNPEYYISKNILKWKTVPVIQVGSGAPRQDDNWDEYYVLELIDTKKKNSSKPDKYDSAWDYHSWNYMGASCNSNFNFKNHLSDSLRQDVLTGVRKDLCFRLRYVYNYLPYGDLSLIIYDYDYEHPFNLE